MLIRYLALALCVATLASMLAVYAMLLNINASVYALAIFGLLYLFAGLRLAELCVILIKQIRRLRRKDV